MKGIVLFSEKNESAILTDEGEVIKLKGSYVVGKRISFKKTDKRSGILKRVSIILGTAAAFAMITTISLYIIGKNSGGDSQASAAASALSIADSTDDSAATGDSAISEADSSAEGNSGDIPEMPPAGNDGSAPDGMPEGAPTGDPGNGQQPQNTAPPDNQQQGAPEQTQSNNT